MVYFSCVLVGEFIIALNDYFLNAILRLVNMVSAQCYQCCYVMLTWYHQWLAVSANYRDANVNLKLNKLCKVKISKTFRNLEEKR